MPTLLLAKTSFFSSFSVLKRPLAQLKWARAATVFIAVTVCASAALAQGVKIETVATGLQNPWAVAFLPDGRFLVTERPGRVRVIERDGKLNKPLEGVPEVAAAGQGGLLDVIVDADFVTNRTLYFCFSEIGRAHV